MCLIIHKPAGRKVPSDVLSSAMLLNRDGVGIMYAEDGRIIIERSLSASLLTKRLPQLKAREVIVHFRMRTHGSIDLDNTHPFEVTDGVAMVHNGILSDYGDEKVSDTRDFNAGVLRPLLSTHPDIYNDPPFGDALEDYIGPNNKILMLRSDGTVWSLNRHTGVEYNGVWLSNTYAWEASGSSRAFNWYDLDPEDLDRGRRLWDALDDCEDMREQGRVDKSVCRRLWAAL